MNTSFSLLWKCIKVSSGRKHSYKALFFCVKGKGKNRQALCPICEIEVIVFAPKRQVQPLSPSAELAARVDVDHFPPRKVKINTPQAVPSLPKVALLLAIFVARYVIANVNSR